MESETLAPSTHAKNRIQDIRDMSPGEISRAFEAIVQSLEDMSSGDAAEVFPEVADGLRNLQLLLPIDLQADKIAALHEVRDVARKHVLDALMKNPAENAMLETEFLVRDIYAGRLIQEDGTHFGTRSSYMRGGIDGLYSLTIDNAIPTLRFSAPAEGYVWPVNWTLVITSDGFTLYREFDGVDEHGATTFVTGEVTDEHDREQAMRQFFAMSLTAAGEVRRRDQRAVRSADEEASGRTWRLLQPREGERAPLRHAA